MNFKLISLVVCLLWTNAVHSLRFLTSSNSSGIQFITQAEFKDLASMFPQLYAIMSSIPVEFVDPQPETHTYVNKQEDTQPRMNVTVEEPKQPQEQPKDIQPQQNEQPQEQPKDIQPQQNEQPQEQPKDIQPQQNEQPQEQPKEIQPQQNEQPQEQPKEIQPQQNEQSQEQNPVVIDKSAISLKVDKSSEVYITNTTHEKTNSRLFNITVLNNPNTTNLTSFSLLLNTTIVGNSSASLNQTNLGYNPIVRIESLPKGQQTWFKYILENATFARLSSEKKDKYDMFAYNPAWIIGLSVIGTIIAVFFLGCIVAICYTRRPYRRPGKVYEIESANRKNNQIPQIPTINPATRTATLAKNKEFY